MENDIRVSVIVASHRPQMICGLLDALKGQNIEGKFFEAIVVCDYSFDNLQNQYHNVRWFFLNDNSISAKRNYGVAQSKGKILAFTDDDCIPNDSWISEGLNYLDEHFSTSAVEGHTLIEPNKSGIGMYRESKRLECPAMRTNNIFYRKKVFLDAGGFDLRFTVQREDADLAFTVIKMGGKIDYCEKIIVKHSFRHWESWDLLKNCWNRRFDPLLYKKHRYLYRKYIGSPLTPTIIIQFCFYILYLTGIKKKPTFFTHMLFIGLIGIRRAGTTNLLHSRFLVECISVISAPFLILVALIYGFIRFQNKSSS